VSEPSAEVLQQLRQLLGEKGITIQPDPVLPDVVLKPLSTEQVSGILRICSAAGQSVVPLGGRTGMANGHFQTGGELGLSLERMHDIEEIDTLNRTMTVQAGCILQLASEAAAEQGLLLPLDFGARGSATIGGNLATNAGGNMVIRYGMVREMVLGLEAVLAVQDFASVIRLLKWLDSQTAGTLSAFEVMWPEFYEYVTRTESTHTPPLAHGSAYYVLVETLGYDPKSDAERFESVLGQAMEDGILSDAVLARSQSQRNEIWEIRDDVLVFFNLGPIIPFDISLTLDAVESFVADIHAGLAKMQEPICVIFGHLGDSNLHLILGSRIPEEFDYDYLQNLLYETVGRYQGSVSAEHGIGLSKRDYLHCSRSESELQLMIAIKRMLDPKNILNPNKIFAADKIAAAGSPPEHLAE
jgi:FAD/FMN-containing dehydrogenase